jgi:uncharacterized protein YcnI
MRIFGGTARPGTIRRRTRLRRSGAATVVTGVLLFASVAFAASASAHVKVSGTDAVQGGYGVITFRVPSESATASTTGVVITFPSATPFTSVDVQPKAGWKATVKKAPLPKPLKNDDGDVITTYVSQVDYEATTKATAIPPGEFDMFNLSAGPLPEAPSMSFAVLQHYSDGSTVNWDEKSANGVEPDHPAPVLQLTAATTDSGGSGVTASAQPASTQAATAQAAAGQASGAASWPGIVGLIAGIVALLVSLAAIAGSRSRGKTSTRA